MIRTQVYLTKKERQDLQSLSKELGIQQSTLIRDAIDQFIEGKRLEKRKKSSAIQEAMGIWADRKDLPNFDMIRKEFDR